MDPISRNTEPSKKSDAFREAIASCNSINSLQTNSLRTAIPQINASIASASFHIFVGYSFSYSSVLIPHIEGENSDIPPASKTLTSLAASILTLTVPIGCLIAVFLMDRIGRVNTIKLASIPGIISFALVATASNIYWILAGRILMGIACAIGSSPAYVYITEVARPELRGSLISSAPTIASLGMLLAFITGAFLNWRVTAWLATIFAILPVIFVQFLVVESPVYLVSKGHIEAAAKSLTYLYKNYPKTDESESLVDMHLRALVRDNEKRIAEGMKSDGKEESSWVGFLKPTGYKPMIILLFLFFIQQFSGIYITLFLSVTFLQDAGADSIDPFISSIFLGLVRFIMSLLNAWLLRKFKRRFLIMLSSFLMAVCMFLSGACTIWIAEGAEKLRWVPVVCLLGFVCSSMLGLLSIPWTLTAEMFPQNIRSKGHSLTFATANILIFAAVQSYRPMLDFLGGSHMVQFFYAFFSILGFFFALCILPETHGKKLSEIVAYFEKKKPANNRVNASDIYSVTTMDKNEMEKMLKRKEIA